MASREGIARRQLLLSGAVAGGALLLGRRADAVTPAPASASGRAAPPVVVPNGQRLVSKVVDGVRVFHLVATPVAHEFTPGLVGECWGYNGLVHGPMIEATEGERVRLYVTNQLAAPTTVHWHGVNVPNGMDGVGGLNQRTIGPGQTFRYEYTLERPGTFMYHPHDDEMTQIALGMTGLFIVHPRDPEPDPPDRDVAIMLHEWSIDIGTGRPNPHAMSDFNVLTINGRCFPGTAPIVARSGERVRIRIGNLGPMEHHAIHLHGHEFAVVATDGGPTPVTAQRPETTVLVPVGSTRTIEFIARPGDWALHCHMTHHAMNQMSHGFPNMVGFETGDLDERMRRLLPGYMTMGQHGMGEMASMRMAIPANSIPMLGGEGPFGVITMGGMFTILKVRDQVAADYADPGWYAYPPGTVAYRVDG